MDARLPKLGSENFLINLSKRLAQLTSAPFDEHLFTSLLFCLAVGDKHLLIRTQDPHAVQRLAKSILFSVFGMNTVALKLKSDSSVDDLLNGLFSVSPIAGFSTQRKGVPRRSNHNVSRTPSYTQQTLHIPPDSSNSRFRLSVAATVTDDERGSVRGLRPLSGRGFIPPDIDASSFVHLPTGSEAVQQASLPHAIVVTGIETASNTVQETLWDVLRTRTVVLEDTDGKSGGAHWNLPDGFMLVAVCPLGDGKSRPTIQKALLDRFAFNSNFVLRPPSQSPHSPVLRRTSLLSREYLEQLQNLVHSTPLSDTLTLYINNMLSSIRLHPQLDSSLVTSRCAQDFVDFVKASHVLAGSDGGVVEVSEFATTDDAKRVVRHVIGHRIDVRKGIHDEVLGSLVSTAVGHASKQGPDGRKTLKEVLEGAISAA